jgi:hypothetical protein
MLRNSPNDIFMRVTMLRTFLELLEAMVMESKTFGLRQGVVGLLGSAVHEGYPVAGLWCKLKPMDSSIEVCN